MGIIEKLGIVPIFFYMSDYCEMIVDEDDLNNVVKQRDEMLEALIESSIILDELFLSTPAKKARDNMVNAIQSATGKTWEQVKELL